MKRRRPVMAATVAVLLSAAAVALVIVRDHHHHAPRLLVGDSPSSTTSMTDVSTTTEVSTTTTARTAASPPPKGTLTTASTTYTGPRGGPRGGIAYRDAGGGISVINPDGSHAHHIADFDQGRTSTNKSAPYLGGETFWGLDWNPAGDLIAAGRDGKYGGGLEVMRPDGTGRRTLVYDSAVEHVSFSPDGQWLVFEDAVTHLPDNAASMKVKIIGVNGQEQRDLGGDAPFGEPDWSPDGTQIVIAAADRVTIVRAADGTKIRDIAMPPQMTATDPAWSPDGAWISFTMGESKTDIYKMHPDGSGTVRLTDTPNNVMAEAASWSPDSSHIAFLERMAAADGSTTSQVWTMTAGGGGQRRLVTTPDGMGQPAWG